MTKKAFLNEEVKQKWEQIIEHESMPSFSDNYRKTVTTIMLENEHKWMAEKGLVQESETPANLSINNASGNVANWDPVLISMVRRSTPNLLAFDIAGVQPMTQPTGLIFCMRARYGTPTGPEALFGEADSSFSGRAGNADPAVGDQAYASEQTGTSDGSPANLVDGTVGSEDPAVDSGFGKAMVTAWAEELGGANSTWNEMAFSIEKTSVTAESRALKASYSVELAQDLRAVHGLDAESELANILSTEILAEQNREMIRRVNVSAEYGGLENGVAPNLITGAGNAKGFIDLAPTGDFAGDTRWFVERWKRLLFQIEVEANKIAKRTRRGRGNFVICSSDVASALSMAGILDHAPAMQTNLNVDDTGNLFAGVLNGKIRVYIDPHASRNYLTVGFRGSNQFDAGIYFAPYIPLEMYKAVGEDNFQPRIGFKTRYGVVANPFATIADPINGDAVNTKPGNGLGQNENFYFRKMLVLNLY